MPMSSEVNETRHTTYHQWVEIKKNLESLKRLTANMDKAISLIENVNERQANSPKFWAQIENKMLQTREPWKNVLIRCAARHEGAANQFGAHRLTHKLPEGIE